MHGTRGRRPRLVSPRSTSRAGLFCDLDVAGASRRVARFYCFRFLALILFAHEPIDAAKRQHGKGEADNGHGGRAVASMMINFRTTASGAMRITVLKLNNAVLRCRMLGIVWLNSIAISTVMIAPRID